MADGRHFENRYIAISQGKIIELRTLRRKAATDKLVEKIVKHDSWPIQPDILNPPMLRLTSKKPLWLDLQPADIKSRCRHNWKSGEVVNSHLVCDPTIRQPGFDLPRQQWSLLNRFRTDLHWSVSLWRDPDDVPHCQILSPDETEWRLISATLTLCGRRRCFVADQLCMVNDTHTRRRRRSEQELSYRKQIAHQLRTQYVEGIYMITPWSWNLG